MTDAQTLAFLLGAPAKAKATRKPSHKFSIGMEVIYCGKEATITGKDGRTWLVTCDGREWPSKGKDMRPA